MLLASRRLFYPHLGPEFAEKIIRKSRSNPAGGNEYTRDAVVGVLCYVVSVAHPLRVLEIRDPQ